MGVLRHRHNHHYIRLSTVITAFTFLLFTSASSAVTSQTQLGGGLHHQSEAGPALERVVTHQKSRLGSSPPSCRSKCGRCSPCKAVHVPIQPGVSIPLEYYPEAWRCKCGNHLFMP
ncbi:EPIDERMAL PATTERNING FACTOR-like protein 5 [Pyrus ussuriensis x Pyrus communis]|uniref:Epidermal patterning factor-like protein n=1 Tax=Pyrus ussuriensis x Pyrus communis TaxID=2448454 RepID=A0A5N5F9G9_9ROSA|nr:EPIDERMAL PATTERNING FACTOR-like protein 5 [Pyrus x bretschneideri]KAB2599695.1 EPIDERMAL PATTERNING FACTOR-like protein 5 [Pyrus ussuriensis x Pyrus communis]